MSGEIGPVVAERWDHDATELGKGPARMALRVSLVRYAEMDTWLGEAHPDASVLSIQPVDAGMAQVVWRVPHEAPKAEAAYRRWRARQEPVADDGFASVTWTETSPGRWVGESSDGATLTAMLATAIPGAWCWTAHGRLYVVGHGLAGSEDEAKRRSWRAWREFEAVREVGTDATNND